MKNLFVVLGLALCATLPASAQNTRVDGVALTRGGMPAAGANVAVCTQVAITAASESGFIATITSTLNPAVGSIVTITGITPLGYNGTWTVLTSSATQFTYTNTVSGLASSVVSGGAISTNPGQACAPLANLCSSLSDSSCGQPNPVQADGLGNYHFYIASGTVYTRALYGAGLSTRVDTDQTAGGGGGSSGGGFICGTTPNVPGLPYWNGTACAIDGGATFDPVNLVWNFEAIVSAGTITAPKFATSGAGGILELQAQTPPLSVPLGKFWLFLNANNGQVSCLNNALTSCFATVQTIASGTATMGTGAITSGGCATAVTATATGAASTDRILATPNVDPTGVTGYGPSASGSLYIQAFPTANTVSFKVCNNTSGTITPAALTLNWAVLR